MNKYIASKNDANRKLIKFVTSIYKHVPKSLIYKIFRKKDIKVNGKRTNDTNYIINENDEIIIYSLNNDILNQEENNKADFLSSKIIYEDENILILNKENGISVHSSSNSLDLQVYKYLKFKQTDSFKPSHVGRLDKETSGLIIYAKNYPTLKQLNEKQSFNEKYYTFKSDYTGPDKLVEFYSFKNEKEMKMAASKTQKPGSKFSQTYIFTKNSINYAKLLSGRKHQIRLTMEFLKSPIYGDVKYGGKKADRLYLHAFKIVFHSLEGHLEYLNEKEFICLPD
ncbi:UNVERIFIED_CONTAM: RluA family pseudouridine synthase [Campylobacter lari]